MRIGEATRLFGVSRDTLERLEQRGLITPGRTPGGHRLYDQRALEQIAEVLRMPVPKVEGHWRGRVKMARQGNRSSA